MKGFQADIYHCGHTDSLSPMRDALSVTIIDEQLPAMHTPSDDSPAVKLVRRRLFGVDYIHAEPVTPGSYAFGGRFIYTCDSRFRELTRYPIPLHDRNMDLETKL